MFSALKLSEAACDTTEVAIFALFFQALWRRSWQINGKFYLAYSHVHINI